MIGSTLREVRQGYTLYEHSQQRRILAHLESDLFLVEKRQKMTCSTLELQKGYTLGRNTGAKNLLGAFSNSIFDNVPGQVTR